VRNEQQQNETSTNIGLLCVKLLEITSSIARRARKQQKTPWNLGGIGAMCIEMHIKMRVIARRAKKRRKTIEYLGGIGVLHTKMLIKESTIARRAKKRWKTGKYLGGNEVKILTWNCKRGMNLICLCLSREQLLFGGSLSKVGSFSLWGFHFK
jgi:hypothetical protein